jgi:hypothetical protein
MTQNLIMSEPVLHASHDNDFSVRCIMTALLRIFKHRCDESGILPGPFRPAGYSFSSLVLGKSWTDKVFYLYFVKNVYNASVAITLNGLRGSWSNSSTYSYVILRSQLTYEFQKTVVHFAQGFVTRRGKNRNSEFQNKEKCYESSLD